MTEVCRVYQIRAFASILSDRQPTLARVVQDQREEVAVLLFRRQVYLLLLNPMFIRSCSTQYLAAVLEHEIGDRLNDAFLPADLLHEPPGPFHPCT